MDKLQPIEFVFSLYAQKPNHTAYCFNYCIKREQIDKELSREQENCLSNCSSKYQQAQKVLSS